jgi:hypothetical protein
MCCGLSKGCEPYASGGRAPAPTEVDALLVVAVTADAHADPDADADEALFFLSLATRQAYLSNEYQRVPRTDPQSFSQTQCYYCQQQHSL